MMQRVAKGHPNLRQAIEIVADGARAQVVSPTDLRRLELKINLGISF
jgi:hypothetical protein